MLTLTILISLKKLRFFKFRIHSAPKALTMSMPAPTMVGLNKTLGRSISDIILPHSYILK